MAIKENMKKLRERYDLTQQELAEIAKVTNKAVWAWENGLSEPRMGAIERIANHFNLKKSQLIEEGGLEEVETIAAHHDDDWTEEELEEIEKFKEYIRSKRNR
ncbi:helix-turn-helix transcriptional regulator [Sediminibacillus halophilus]|uniref:DNA-binding transcriptional regulator, XRE-family HTH domain n=1 Tax=Sediminibacillus halophilus TaxID=482461 RepID=A0A1G9QXC5_9BACI|nr:helix-turn-helix transcriptional regulator [Sediminibacillus halophilus]SDM15692.1 DNA-binding transcriptional regulator, XRE-family HTH domain [Sediminibacillus halophilus]